MNKVEQNALWEAYFRDRSVENRNRVAEAYHSYVKALTVNVKQSLPAYIESCDLEQAGMLGLLESIERYKPEKAQFTTFCTRRVVGAMLDYIRENDEISRQTRQRSHMLSVMRDEFRSEHGREPFYEEMSRKIGISAADFERWFKAAWAVPSTARIEMNADDDRSVLTPEVLIDKRAEDPAEAAARRDIETALAEVDHRSREILRMYYIGGLRMKEVGRVLRLSESRICQIVNESIEVLQSHFSEKENPMAKWTQEQVVEAYEKTACDREAAKMLGVCSQRFQQMRKKYNLPAKGRVGTAGQAERKETTDDVFMEAYNKASSDSELAKILGVTTKAASCRRQRRNLPAKGLHRTNGAEAGSMPDKSAKALKTKLVVDIPEKLKAVVGLDEDAEKEVMEELASFAEPVVNEIDRIRKYDLFSGAIFSRANNVEARINQWIDEIITGIVEGTRTEKDLVTEIIAKRVLLKAKAAS